MMIHHGTSSLSHFDRHAASPRATTGLGSRVCVGVWVGDIRLSSFAGVCAHVKEGSCQSGGGGLELDHSCRLPEGRESDGNVVAVSLIEMRSFVPAVKIRASTCRFWHYACASDLLFALTERLHVSLFLRFLF
jgi:hypothetical protein